MAKAYFLLQQNDVTSVEIVEVVKAEKIIGRLERTPPTTPSHPDENPGKATDQEMSTV